MRERLREFLKLKIQQEKVGYEVLSECPRDGYREILIRFLSADQDSIPAYILVPEGSERFPAVQVHHQHAGQRHLGKSEVIGLKGDPFQALGPALARKGMVVLAADSICFEDRRFNLTGTEPGDDDWTQHFNEMTFRLVQGDTLMRKVLSDASRGISLLAHLPFVDPNQIGVLGHSYGGNTVLFQAATDDRIAFACSSGAAASFRDKFRSRTPLEFSLAIPGFAEHFDTENLIEATFPRPLLLVSATEDPYSHDAEDIVRRVSPATERASRYLQHQRYTGGHALDSERFEFIVNWMTQGFQKT